MDSLLRNLVPGGVLLGLAILVVRFDLATLPASLLVMLLKNLGRMRALPLAALLPSLGGLSLRSLVAAPFDLSMLFLTFLKIGSVLFGSGYVLLAFLQADLVDKHRWLTQDQLLDAIAVTSGVLGSEGIAAQVAPHCTNAPLLFNARD